MASERLVITQLIDQQAVADMFGVTVTCLRNWRRQGVGPKFIKLGASSCAPVRYRLEDVEAWLSTCERTTEDQGAP